MNNFNYLPVLSREAVEEIPSGNVTKALDELKCQKYERIGLDRFFYILADVGRNFGSTSGFRFLDIGCNTGLIANLLSAYGNSAVGIDNAIIDNQKLYSGLDFNRQNMAVFLKKDIDDYLLEMETQNLNYDFILLLSVAHQWEFGYAQSMTGKKSEAQIHAIMDGLLSHSLKAVYYECPISEPGFYNNYGIDFLARFLTDYHNISIVKLADTVASNGYIRALYRITKVTSSGEPLKVAPLDWVSLKAKYGWNGKVVHHSSDDFTNAILQKESLVIQLKTKDRDFSHPMGAQHSHKTISALWEKIRTAGLPHIMPIHRIYTEGLAEIPILNGIPGQDTAMVPLWQQQRLQNSISLKPTDLSHTLNWLHELSDGLAALHVLNIAHGDPFPFNIIIQNEHATWIDLGNVSDDPCQIHADIIIFISITCQYYLQQAAEQSTALLKRIAELRPAELDICQQLAEIFSCNYTDVRIKAPGDDLLIANSLQHILNALFSQSGWSQQMGIPLKSLYHYYIEFCYWQKKARLYEQISQLDRFSNEFSQLENIRERVSSDQMHIQLSKIVELKNYIQELNTSTKLQMEKSAQQLISEKKEKEQLQIVYSELMAENQRIKLLYEKKDQESIHLSIDLQHTEESLEQTNLELKNLQNKIEQKTLQQNELLSELEQTRMKLERTTTELNQTQLKLMQVKKEHQNLITEIEQKKLKNRIKHAVNTILKK